MIEIGTTPEGRQRYVRTIFEAGLPVGAVQWWVDEERVPLGKHMVPKTIELVLVYDGLRPTLKMTVAMIGGAPRCQSVTLMATSGGREPNLTDLRALRLIDLVELVVRAATVSLSWPVVTPDGVAYSLAEFQSPTDAEILAATRDARKHRKIDDAFKRRIAEIYVAHIDDGNPTQAVVDALELDVKTEWRKVNKWLAAAQDAGYLVGPAHPGGKRSIGPKLMEKSS